MDNQSESFEGILAIGDPHLECRVPGFRKDDYPRVVLDKLTWCLTFAEKNNLLPILLGDVFHLPRDNANWLLGELMVLFHRGVLGIYGNHDVRENELSEDDSLDVLIKAGRYRLLDASNPWTGKVNGQYVVIGGTSWGKMLPASFHPNPETGTSPLVLWVTHHDVKVPGYEEQGRFDPREIPGVQAVINGHIHRQLADVQAGSTVWITPGNIARRQRSDATKQHIPSALRIDVSPKEWSCSSVEVPHKPFDEVFYDTVLTDSDILGDSQTLESAFVTGLAEMLARKTETAAGLMAFLELHLGQFEPAVASEIRKLAEEVTRHGNQDDW